MTITNVELKNVARHYKVNLEQVLMKDELRSYTIKPNSNYIINLQSSTAGKGSHWTSISTTKSHAFYFDSFGSPPPIEVKVFIEKVFPKYGYNSKEIQALDSVYCGWFCIYLFIYLKKVTINTFYETCNGFTNSFELNRRLNDLLVREYFRKIKPKSKIAIEQLHI
jgi:hypothetical protein